MYMYMYINYMYTKTPIFLIKKPLEHVDSSVSGKVQDVLAICQLLLNPADVPTSDLDMAGACAILMGGIPSGKLT